MHFSLFFGSKLIIMCRKNEHKCVISLVNIGCLQLCKEPRQSKTLSICMPYKKSYNMYWVFLLQIYVHWTFSFFLKTCTFYAVEWLLKFDARCVHIDFLLWRCFMFDFYVKRNRKRRFCISWEHKSLDHLAIYLLIHNNFKSWFANPLLKQIHLIYKYLEAM